MTREEAIICKIYLEDLDKHHTCNEYKLLMGLLEQEPCNDCISRQDAVNACRNGWGYDDETIEHIVGNILGLPPVTPAEKVGRWEYVQYDGNPNIGNWHCSECRYIVNYEPTYNWEKKPYHKFCPMCGAKMEEVENEMHIIGKSPTGAEGSDKE